jgi:5-methyltetrahydropteroyltriglutamate--homocysteine methyltransferase
MHNAKPCLRPAKGRVHASEAKLARAHTKKKLKITMPSPMTIIDTIADEFYGDRVKMAFAFAGLLNQEARALQADGVDVIQFDKPRSMCIWTRRQAGASTRCIARPTGSPARKPCTSVTATGSRPILIGRRHSAASGGNMKSVFPALAKSRIDQVSLECRNSRVPAELMKLLDGKDVQVGVIDVASDKIETPEDVAAVIGEAMKYVAKEKIIASTNCGMAPMRRDVAVAKLQALGTGAQLARRRFG